MLEIVLAFSMHFIPGDWNEVHPGIRYEQDNFMGALFMNSEGNTSLALGVVGRHEFSDSVDFFGEAGLATGYSGGAVVPFVRAGIEYNDRLRLFVAPAMNTDGDIGAVGGLEIIALRF